MTTFAAAGEPPGLIEKAELHGLVAVVLLGADLEHMTRAGLHNGDGDAQSRFVINLRHPDLAAEYSLRHRCSPYATYGLVASQDRERISRIPCAASRQ